MWIHTCSTYDKVTGKVLLEFLNWDVALIVLLCTAYYLNNSPVNLEFGGTSLRTQVEEIPCPQDQLIQDMQLKYTVVSHAYS